MSNESYLTVSNIGYSEFEIKRSRFIGFCSNIMCESEAIMTISSQRMRYPGSRHTVYAYEVNEDGIYRSRYSDDGEPQGTGGLPVLSVIKKQSVTNCIITVTRYFGGILLGTGCLSGSYTKAASDAILDAGICAVTLCRHISFDIDYSMYAILQSKLSRTAIDYVKDDVLFGNTVNVSLYVPVGSVEAMQHCINEMLSYTVNYILGDMKHMVLQKNI